MSRDINLGEFGIDKPSSVTNVTNFDNMEDMTKAKRLAEEQKEDYINKMMDLIQVVRNIKNSFTGNLYDDFYNMGVPSNETD